MKNQAFAVTNFDDFIDLRQNIAVVRDHKNSFGRIFHPVEKAFFGGKIHKVGRLVDKRELRVRMDNFNRVDKAFLPARKCFHPAIFEILKPKIAKFGLDFFFDKVKILLVKSVERVGVFFDQAQIFAHFRGQSFDLVAKSRVIGKVVQNEFENGLFTDIRIFLTRAGKRGVFSKNNLARKILVATKQNRKKRRFSDSVSTNQADFFARVHTKFHLRKKLFVTKRFFRNFNAQNHS